MPTLDEESAKRPPISLSGDDLRAELPQKTTRRVREPQGCADDTSHADAPRRSNAELHRRISLRPQQLHVDAIR